MTLAVSTEPTATHELAMGDLCIGHGATLASDAFIMGTVNPGAGGSKVAAGVAWVSRAVETTPVASPASSAISHRLIVVLAAAVAQLNGSTPCVTPSVPLYDLTPVVIATAVGAESATCASCV